MKYSETFKAKMVQKMLGGRSANAPAREVGVNQPTLSRWLREAGTIRTVKRGKRDEPVSRTEGRRPEEWSAEEKLGVVSPRADRRSSRQWSAPERRVPGALARPALGAALGAAARQRTEARSEDGAP